MTSPKAAATDTVSSKRSSKGALDLYFSDVRHDELAAEMCSSPFFGSLLLPTLEYDLS